VSPRLWLGTFIALVFVSGALAGVILDRSFLVRAPDERPFDNPGRGDDPGRGPGRTGGGSGRPSGPPVDRLVGVLDRELGLDTTQREAVRQILQGRRERLQRVQDETRQRFVEEQQALINDIAAVLTADQATTLRQIARQRPDLVAPDGRGRGVTGGRPGGSRRGGRE
jgi:hypothetical protein